MKVLPALALTLTLFGNLLLSLGMILQKRHVGWLGRKKGEGREEDQALWRRDRGGWALGFLLMNCQPLFNYLGLLGLPAAVVAAAAGSNVAFTALLSTRLLGERLKGRTVAGMLVLFAAIGLAGLRGGRPDGNFAEGAYWLFLGLPLVAAGAMLGLRKKLSPRSLGPLLSGLAGALGGTMLLSLGALAIRAGGPSLGWLASPYLYAYLLGGVTSFGLVQLAYKSGLMSRTAPVFYGLQVLWPALSASAVFGSSLDPLQALAFLLIAASVAYLSLV